MTHYRPASLRLSLVVYQFGSSSDQSYKLRVVLQGLALLRAFIIHPFSTLASFRSIKAQGISTTWSVRVEEWLLRQSCHACTMTVFATFVVP